MGSGEEVSQERTENSIQVSMTKKPTFYARIGKRMFTGNEEKNPFDEVIITGLGSATKIAIGAASIMEKEDIGQITKVQTAYFSSDRINRRIPKITIVLKRHPDFVAN
ncbi:DNA/RNA-binding protein Alba 3, putative [Plasmodium relictum]|uniref:DNA/RNA-binding protein Alba 3, putative n=1 Tax=Plasmodium relictum TaxID=85471 RepID=A0A1J1H3X9_PLARL|nr:DNA/RNA-binding protein Alba 3, putative [Plasmodium relictum]CRG99614.1 DNA/RNA-binding protein Alba 3, putative [Plasmodium relictum]